MQEYKPPSSLKVLCQYQGNVLVGIDRSPRGKRRRLPWERGRGVGGGGGTFEVEVEELKENTEQVEYIPTGYGISFDRLYDACLYLGLPRDDIDHGGGSFKKTPYSSDRVNTMIVTKLLSPGLPWCVPIEEDSIQGFLPREVIDYLLLNSRREETTTQFRLPKYRVCLTRTIIGTARPKKRKLASPVVVFEGGEMSSSEEDGEDI